MSPPGFGKLVPGYAGVSACKREARAPCAKPSVNWRALRRQDAARAKTHNNRGVVLRNGFGNVYILEGGLGKLRKRASIVWKSKNPLNFLQSDKKMFELSFSLDLAGVNNERLNATQFLFLSNMGDGVRSHVGPTKTIHVQ